MSEPPPGGKRAAISDAIKDGERAAGERTEGQFGQYFLLAKDLTDLAGAMIERALEQAPEEPGAFHACAIIASRLLTELQAVVHLVQLGYAAQAVSLCGTMIELMHAVAYIGEDETRAAQYFAWNDPKVAFPGPVRRTMREVALALGAERAVVEREYDQVYRQIKMVNHGNPMAEVTMVMKHDSHFIVIGPVLEPSADRLAAAALAYAIKYAQLGCIVFFKHVKGVEQEVLDVFRGLSDRANMLNAELNARFAAEDAQGS
jgi:hypothetical protein